MKLTVQEIDGLIGLKMIPERLEVKLESYGGLVGVAQSLETDLQRGLVIPSGQQNENENFLARQKKYQKLHPHH